MELTAWLPLLAICTLGAMSPGPSVAIIIQITAKQGRTQGVIASIAHGIGVGCYAILAVLGLAVALEQSPLVFQTLQLLGAAFLAYIGFKSLGIKLPNSKPAQHSDEAQHEVKKTHLSSNSFIVGFLTAALNPKVALFFIALFSQFVRPDAGITEKAIMTSTPAIVDALWYSIVAIVVSRKKVAEKFSRYGPFLQKAFGVLLIVVAISVAWG